MMRKWNLYMTVAWILAGLLLMGAACSKNDHGKTSRPPADSTPVAIHYVDTLPDNAPFVHPGLLQSQGDFDRMIAQVNAGREPWLSGWDKLTANSHAQAGYTAMPVKTLIRGGSSREEPSPDNYSSAFNDAAAAYQLAIRWKISGDASYAAAGVKVLNAWAATCDTIAGNSNKALVAGLQGYQFANAAEILRSYSGWDADDFHKFQQWMLDVFYPRNEEFITGHYGTCISHYWANWDLCNLASIMAIGVLTDKRQLYNQAIWYFQHGLGNGNLFKAVHPVFGDSIAQIQESGRDQGHCTLDIALLGVICQQAWSQGDDLFGLDSNLFLKGAEYVARYNVGGLDVPYQTYNNCDNVNQTVISSSQRGTVRPMWELVYNHYVVLKGLNAHWVTVAARTVRPEGGGGDYGPNSGGFDQLGFGTLLYTLDATD